MPKSLILNTNNIIPNSGNSTLQYVFPQGGIAFKDDFIAIQQVSIYNSVFNVSVANNNNSFSYIWVDGTTHLVNIPDSYLELPEINAYLQSIMIANKHYLIAGANNVYLLNIQINPARYSYQINSFLL